MFDQIFLSQQVKPSDITSNKHDINVLPHELSNNDLRKVKNIRKIPKLNKIIVEWSVFFPK